MKENHLNLIKQTKEHNLCNNNKDHTISNVTDFTRTTNFIINDEDKIFIN